MTYSRLAFRNLLATLPPDRLLKHNDEQDTNPIASFMGYRFLRGLRARWTDADLYHALTFELGQGPLTAGRAVGWCDELDLA